MPIDPTGTKPGLAPSAVTAPNTIHIKCKRPECKSILAVEITGAGGQGRHIYRCVECNTTWGVATGGCVDI